MKAKLVFEMPKYCEDCILNDGIMCPDYCEYSEDLWRFLKGEG